MIDYDLLSRLQLFQQVELDTIRDLLADCPVSTHPAGTILLSPEKANDRMYILLEGRVSIRISMDNSAPITWVNQGESVGEMSAHDGLGASAIVETEVETRVLEISSEKLLGLIDRSHTIARNLLYLMAERIRSGNRAMSISLGLQKKFEQHANLDSLTTLLNRRWLDTYLDDLFELPEEDLTAATLSVLMIDVDHFKRFNDTSGHLAGDEALRAVAKALKTSVRASDYVARFGGEEFTVILPGTAVEHAVRVADKIRKAVAATALSHEGKALPGVTVSIGIAGLIAGDTPLSLKQAADEALYQAKQQGRDRSCVAVRHAQTKQG